MVLKKILLQIFFSLGLLSSNLFVSAQLRVIDNKGTISVVDESKWTRIGVTNDIYNKYPGNVGIGTSTPVATLHNAGSTLFSTLNLANFTTNGAIGGGGATVDIYTSINIPQTTAGITLTIPDPTNTTAGRILQVSNTGTSPVTVGAALIGTAQTAEFVYNGSAWANTTTGVTTVGTTTTAQANGASITGTTLNLSIADATNPGLVSTTAQTIAGAKTWNGLGFFNAGLTATGGSINLNASTAYATNIGNGTNNLILLGTTDINQIGSANTRIGNTTGTLTLEGGMAATAIQIGNGATAHGIQIGTGAAANTLLLGSTNSTSTTTIQGGSGTGAIAIDPASGGGIVIGDPAGTGEITLGNSSAAQTINVGTGAGVSTVNIGSTAANSIVKVKSPLLRTIGVAVVVSATGTLSALNMAKGSVFRYTGAANGTLTLDTGTNLSAALPGVEVGDMISFVVSNNTTNRTVTMAGAVGTTLGVAGITIALRQSRTFYAINTGTNTWTIY